MPSLVEIGKVVLEKKIFKFRQCTYFFLVLFRNYTPLKKKRGLSFEQTCQKWEKFTDGRTDTGRQVINHIETFSSGELKTAI